MSELQLIESTLARAGRRRRWQRAWRGFWRGLLMGLAVWLLALGAYKVLPIPASVLTVGGLVALVAAFFGLVIGGWRCEQPLSTARWLDQRQQFQERLSTALELGTADQAGQWRGLVVNDAVNHLKGLDLRRLLPYHLSQASRWALLGLVLSVSLGFLPEYRSKDYLRRQREKEAVREAGRQLADLSRRSLERRKPALEPTREAVKSVGELGNQLEKNPVVRTEAMRDLAKMTDKLQQQTKELGKNPALKSMEQAARSTGKTNPAEADELKRQIEALQKSLGSKEANADALEKLRQELQKAQQAAANLLGKDSKAADAARDSLAKALSDLAKQAQDLGAALPSLEEAIAALEGGKIDQVLKDLQIAEKDLDKIREMAQALQQLQQQAAKLGKDLAEQLKNGQGEAALQTLLKMVDKLKSSDLSEDQLKAVMDEVAKAVEPAAPYGKMADHLKAAVKQMQQGQKGPAAQSLADAAKELAELMQQMADVQDLKGMLNALKRAQFAVGNAGRWGNLPGPPRAGKGGKPGSGVGTWADEEGWTGVLPETQAWDNSNVQRPDTDARGFTDRGEGKLPEGMTPTKVKGQLSPGGQMPSITLKGVSIKGQSTVALQEAITAAQSEAQAALSHEQVPRAYQGAVKDYFGELKK
jgi:predicted  nucleic acid-binding Zn-ribbon protein